MRIGLLTSRHDPALTGDDRLGVAALARRGHEVQALVWEQVLAGAGRDLQNVDLLVFRSCWSYHETPAQFLAFLDLVAASGVPVHNPIPVIRWNLDKGYLLGLAARGVAIPRTVWLPAGEGAAQIWDGPGEEILVLKPAISLNGHGALRMRRDDPNLDLQIAGARREGPVVVQAYLPEIETTGELSLVFLGGRYSHAIRKLPAPGEFRVQVEHGGRRVPARPSPAQIAQAEEILAAAPGPLLYARVDVVEQGDRLVLMELEAIDPFLFLGYAEGAAEQFADVVAPSS